MRCEGELEITHENLADLQGDWAEHTYARVCLAEGKTVIYNVALDHSHIDFLTVDKDLNVELVEITTERGKNLGKDSRKKRQEAAMQATGLPYKIITTQDLIDLRDRTFKDSSKLH